MPKKLLFSVTKDDFEIQTFRAGGKGGQNQNKVNSGVRIIHRASGARGEARDSRDQGQNKRSAFIRLTMTKEWLAWHKAETLRRLGAEARAWAAVDSLMDPDNLQVEVRGPNGTWQPWKAGEGTETEVTREAPSIRAPGDSPDEGAGGAGDPPDPERQG